MYRFLTTAGVFLGTALWLVGCGSLPPPEEGSHIGYGSKTGPLLTPLPDGGLALRDSVQYSQRDPRWSGDQLGSVGSDTMGSDGCLVTAAAMALVNLGFEVTPKDLNQRLKKTKSFTSKGWLIWDGVRRVTDGRAEAVFYDNVSADIIDGCMAAGQYPLVQFKLPNGRSHWAAIVRHDERGYHMRDPLRISKKPLIFPAGIKGYRAVRCVGLTK